MGESEKQKLRDWQKKIIVIDWLHPIILEDGTEDEFYEVNEK